jgi:hypothetical protein
VVGSCEHSNEPLGFIKGRKFVDKLSDYLLKNHCASWSWLAGQSVSQSVSQL